MEEIINNVLDKHLQELPGFARFSFGTGRWTTPSLILLPAITFYQPTQNKRLARLFISQINPSDHTGKDQQSLPLSLPELCSVAFLSKLFLVHCKNTMHMSTSKYKTTLSTQIKP